MTDAQSERKAAERARWRERTGRYRRKNAEKWQRDQQRRHLWSKYQMTPEDYELLATRQNGLCAICERPPSTGKLSVDHVKGTSPAIVRGLLCPTCNAGIGMLDHDVGNLSRAIAYLSN